MEDLTNVNQCTSISELITKEVEIKDKSKEVDEKFDSLYEKITNNNEGENFEAIVSINKSSKTAVITPIVRKKTLVDYESSESESDDLKNSGAVTPHPKLVPKTPRQKRQRAGTPHTKKLFPLMRQKVVEEYEETINDDDYDSSPVTNKTTSLRHDATDGTQAEMTTPTSHVQHNILKLALAVTTSTPTHPVAGGWSMFPEQGADSPLSEIENPESPAQNLTNEASKNENFAPKLKSIIITGTRLRLGSQDSSEKHVTFQDSANSTEVSSIKTKKVKFADGTVFEQENKLKRVYRKPKRLLTPGPQKKYCLNPRFQALINRFENNGQTMARTPIQNKEKIPDSTPPVGEHAHMPARAINFKEDSPIVERENTLKESNELFKSCVESPVQNVGINNAITALTTNIAGSLQNCLSSVLKASEEETEIQFKFVITKKKVSVKRIVDDKEGVDERSSEIERNVESNKENIWSSVAKAVRNVFWGEHGDSLAISTPHNSSKNDSTSSSASKRKCSELSDVELSPLNHKKYKYGERICGRPPLRRSKTWGVSNIRSSLSAGQQSLIKEVSLCQDEAMNLSF
ncbi:unnamed protein product [Diatraea saccharalis]|uniref:Uncharacterized protein n=1 Tax=Diatraea saccharalis TaxID=40085 RepID=A0A9N9WE67_9NEOP|nr:unnamed protein product [Diatraea saccharalis]